MASAKLHSWRSLAGLFGALVLAGAAACAAEVGEPEGAGAASPGLTGGTGAAASGSAPGAAGLAGVGGVFVTGGGGTATGGGSAGGPPAISCDVAALLLGCSSAICHQSSRREGDLALDFADPLSPAMARELIGARASYSGVEDAASCPAEREIRVDPANLGESLLLKKLEGRQTCGEVMPNVDEVPTAWLPENRAQSIQCVREWLENLVALNP